MTDRRLIRIVAGFRAGILNGRPSALMCFAVCAPLHTYLSLLGVETRMVEARFAEVNHVWLALEDGRILDPTADQFGLEPVYLGSLPRSYEMWMQAVSPSTERPKE